jgi:hypothetical protein
MAYSICFPLSRAILIVNATGCQQSFGELVRVAEGLRDPRRGLNHLYRHRAIE